MLGSGSWDLWGTQARWEDPSLQVVEYSLEEFNEAHLSEWLANRKSTYRGPMGLLTVLKGIRYCLQEFKKHVNKSRKALEGRQDDGKGHDRNNPTGDTTTHRHDDAFEKTSNPAVSEPKWQHRLGPLLKLVVNQHVKLFQHLHNLAKDVSMDKNQRERLEGERNDFDVEKKGLEDILARPVFDEPASNSNSKTQDLKREFNFMKSRWICRYVEEISLLILRCDYDDNMPTEVGDEIKYLPRTELHKRSLESFLRYLSAMDRHGKSSEDSQRPPKGEKSSGGTKKEDISLVPMVICFDETARAIGAARHFWDQELSPWIFGDDDSVRFDFFTMARDSRIPQEIHENHFEPAVQAFEDATFKTFGRGVGSKRVAKKLFSKEEEAEDNQSRLHTVFGEMYFGPLRQYERHVWQAIDGRSLEFKSQCTRCRIYWNAILVNPNSNESPHDTHSESRPAPCAESCLHAELTKRR